MAVALHNIVWLLLKVVYVLHSGCAAVLTGTVPISSVLFVTYLQNSLPSVCPVIVQISVIAYLKIKETNKKALAT